MSQNENLNLISGGSSKLKSFPNITKKIHSSFVRMRTPGFNFRTKMHKKQTKPLL